MRSIFITVFAIFFTTAAIADSVSTCIITVTQDRNLTTHCDGKKTDERSTLRDFLDSAISLHTSSLVRQGYTLNSTTTFDGNLKMFFTKQQQVQ